MLTESNNDTLKNAKVMPTARASMLIATQHNQIPIRKVSSLTFDHHHDNASFNHSICPD